MPETWFSHPLRPLLGLIFSPLAIKHPKGYLQQFPEGSKNLELTLESLLDLVKHPRKGVPILKEINYLLGNYIATQGGKVKHHLVYTEKDHRLPFIPEDDNHYNYIVAHTITLVKELIKYPSEEIKTTMSCFREASDLAAEIFRACPSTMPRFKDHNRLALRAIQSIDNPVNCCPSLHIAYSLLAYNVGKVLRISQRNPSLWSSMENAAKLMILPVLTTKQHALIDVSFGMLTAKTAYEKYFEGFDDLRGTFLGNVPYSEVFRVYDENFSGDDLVKKVKGYLQQFPLVEPGEKAYFDTITGELVRL